MAYAVLVPMRLRHWADLKASGNKGVFGCMLPLFNTASMPCRAPSRRSPPLIKQR